LAKDEVERSLPLLKKHYLKYADYAGVAMKDVFYGWVDTIRPQMAETLGSAVCYGDGRGNFEMKEMPADMQLAPIFSFEKIGAGQNLYVGGGNFFDVIPYEGQYDAQAIALFSFKQDSVYTLPPSFDGHYRGQVRDIKWMRIGKDSVLMVAMNNDSLKTVRVRVIK
jgi:hypothetical protein